MSTGLWAIASGLAPGAIVDAVPPSCRRAVDAPSALVADGDDVLVQTPAWSVDGATQLLPAFSALTEQPPSVRFEIAARVGGAWTPWTSGITLGPARFAPLPPAPPLESDVDVFRTAAPVEAVRLRARLRAAAPALAGTSWMLSLSASAAPPAPSALVAAPPVRLAVPALSQMERDPTLARRICSPTCVAMVLRYWQRAVSPESLAGEMFHADSDLFGVWPAAIAAAGRHGVAGYLLRFPDWTAAAWCLQQRLPIIASVRYADGELSGAAIAATAGHLLVLTGIDGDAVLVNDPAAATAADVPRRYRSAELARVWLQRTGVGYVLFAPRR
jgi:peptidase C39-like protein